MILIVCTLRHRRVAEGRGECGMMFMVITDLDLLIDVDLAEGSLLDLHRISMSFILKLL